MSTAKRAGEADGGLVITKRARTDEAPAQSQVVVARDAKGQQVGLPISIGRTSGLHAPIMALNGHTGEIVDLRFDSTGQLLVTASMDKYIFLWRVYGDGEGSNYGMFKTHAPKAFYTSVMFSPDPASSRLFAASTDGSLTTFDLKTGAVVRRHRPTSSRRAVTSFAGRAINSVDCTRAESGRELLLTAGDDGSIRVWDVDAREPVEEQDFGFPLTCAKWSADGQQCYVGGIDNDVHVFDLRRKQIAYSLRAHSDTICGLALSPDGSYLASASFDNTLRIWDVRPFAPTVNPQQASAPPRLYRTLMGAPAGFDNALRKPSWDPSGRRVGIGSADRTVTVWEVETGSIKYKLPGAKGTVTCFAFSPNPDEPIIASAGVDRQILLGELDAR